MKTLPDELLTLTKLIDESCGSLVLGNPHIQKAALTATKFIFDLALETEARSHPPIAEFLSFLTPLHAPTTRSQSREQQAVHAEWDQAPPAPIEIPTTPLTALFTDGMDADQIWQQLDLRGQRVCELLNQTLEGNRARDAPNAEEGGGEGQTVVPIDVQDGEKREELRQVLVDLGINLQDTEHLLGLVPDDDDEVYDDGMDLGEGVEELRDESDDDDGEEDSDASQESDSEERTRKIAKKSPLDDDFFNLARFNAEAEEAEARSVSKGSLGPADDDDDDDNVDDVIDFSQPVHVDGDQMEDTSGELYYRDFFAPPPRGVRKGTPKPKTDTKSPSQSPSRVRFHEEVRVKKIKARGRGRPVWTMYRSEDEEEDDEEDEEEFGEEDEDEEMKGYDEMDESEDMSREEEPEDGRDTIERFKDDLFAEDTPETDGTHPDLTTHEKHQAALRAQIAALEAENVAPKPWTLQGEASARARPHDSLLAEDLDFERVSTSAPAPRTESAILALEERIRARILDGAYDDVVRVADAPAAAAAYVPSRLLELKEGKEERSLAEIYEGEYAAAQGAGVDDDRDGRLAREHREIERTWEALCDKLDALCNAHFVPKQPRVTIESIPNVSAATLESAMPSATSARALLAPEEIYAPPRGVAPAARSELTPGEKRALRNKARKGRKSTRERMQRAAAGLTGGKTKAGVVKSGKGVTVIGKGLNP